MRNFIEWLMNESMNLYIANHNNDAIHDLDDISTILKKKVVDPMFNKLSKDEQKAVIDGGFYQHWSIGSDGSYYNDGNQVINFYTSGWGNNLSKVLAGIKYYLDEIKYGAFKEEKSGMFDGNVVRIPILSFNSSGPPALNLSNSNAILIFRDLLGYHYDDGFSSINPRDLLIKINNLPDYSVDLHQRDPYTQQGKKGAMMISGGLSSDDIHQRLNQISKIAQWAISNNYDELYLA